MLYNVFSQHVILCQRLKRVDINECVDFEELFLGRACVMYDNMTQSMTSYLRVPG